MTSRLSIYYKLIPGAFRDQMTAMISVDRQRLEERHLSDLAAQIRG